MNPNHVDSRKKIDQLKRKLDAKKVATKKANRRSTAALFEEGINAYKQEDWKTAISKWNQVLEQDPNNKKAKDYIQRAKTKLQLLGQ